MKKHIRQETAIKIVSLLENIKDADIELIFAIFIEMAKTINRIDQWGILCEAKLEINAQLNKLRKENKK